MDKKTKVLIAALSAAGLAAAGGVPTAFSNIPAEVRPQLLPVELQRPRYQYSGHRYQQFKELPTGDPAKSIFSVTLKTETDNDFTTDFVVPELRAGHYLVKDIGIRSTKGQRQAQDQSISVLYQHTPNVSPWAVKFLQTDMQQYLVQNLHLSKEQQERIGAIREVHIVRQSGEDLPMSPVDPISALTAIGAVLKIIDSLTGQWDRIFKKKTESEKPHSVTAEKETVDTIVVRRNGKPVETITAADLETLDPDKRALFKAIEGSMQRQFKLWTAVYPQKDASVDPIVNAQVQQRLDDIARTMCGEMSKLFRYLDSIGKHLEDHYDHVRFICNDITGGAS